MAAEYKQAIKKQKRRASDTLTKLTDCKSAVRCAGVAATYKVRCARSRDRGRDQGGPVEARRITHKRKRTRRINGKKVLVALHKVWVIPVCRWHRQV